MIQDEPKIEVKLPSTPRAVAWLVRFEDTTLHATWKAADLNQLFGWQWRLGAEAAAENAARERYWVESSFWLAVVYELLKRKDVDAADRQYLETRAKEIGKRRGKVADLGYVAAPNAFEAYVNELMDKLNGVHVPVDLKWAAGLALAALVALAVLVVVRK